MTTLTPDAMRCALCGELSEHLVVGSSSSFGPPDLDTRPAELVRSTLPYWVRQGPVCGYCASDLPCKRATTILTLGAGMNGYPCLRTGIV